MSSVERYAVERSIRRLEHVHQQLASALICTEEDIADLKRAVASDDAARALSGERRKGIPAQRRSSDRG